MITANAKRFILSSFIVATASVLGVPGAQALPEGNLDFDQPAYQLDNRNNVLDAGSNPLGSPSKSNSYPTGEQHPLDTSTISIERSQPLEH